MQPWIHLDTAKVPGGGELKLMQRGSEFSINAGPLALMTSWMSSSEIALAEIACERLRGRPKIHILIGGYGMGFTLRAALAALPADAKVTVAEIVPPPPRYSVPLVTETEPLPVSLNTAPPSK